MSKFLYAWNEASEGAKALAQAMDIRRIKHERSQFRGNARKTVINWGSSELPPQVQACRVLNTPERVAVVSNKLAFFQSQEDPYEGDAARVPQFTTDHEVARQWLVDGKQVCARKKLRGSNADGLVIMGPGEPQEWTRAPLYTMYVKKRDEFRVHIVNGEVIDTQRKAKRNGYEGDRNTQIRNLVNGYIFAREGFVVPDDVILQAKLSMAASGLDFGAVDVIYNARDNQAFVLEINSAPGLMGTTLERYATALGAL